VLIKDKDFTIYRDLYEPMYLYANIHVYDVSPITGMECSRYKNIEKFIDIFIDSSTILWHEALNGRLSLHNASDYEVLIFDKFNEFKACLISDWLVESSDLSINNFYSKNVKRLNEFNGFIANEVKLVEGNKLKMAKQFAILNSRRRKLWWF